ncbi:MAG: FAD-dependent monooxygenase, partial [Janthinobacterium lividum]
MALQNGRGATANRQVTSVLISGASFAGLATAWWMNQLGYSVTIVEISSGLRKGGTPVDIRDGVIDVVKRMNLLDRIISASLPSRPVTFLDAAGTPLFQVQGQKEEEPEASYEIERNVLLDMLFNEVNDNVEFLFSDSISGLEQQSANDVSVTFSSGVTRSFSLVLGCDGTHSAVR